MGPEGAAQPAVRKLGTNLHDGVLERVRHEGEDVVLTLDVDFVRQHHGLPDTARFELRVLGVSSLKAVRWEPPPYACPATRGLSHADARKVIEEW